MNEWVRLALYIGGSIVVLFVALFALLRWAGRD